MKVDLYSLNKYFLSVCYKQVLFQALGCSDKQDRKDPYCHEVYILMAGERQKKKKRERE